MVFTWTLNVCEIMAFMAIFVFRAIVLRTFGVLVGFEDLLLRDLGVRVWGLGFRV